MARINIETLSRDETLQLFKDCIANLSQDDIAEALLAALSRDDRAELAAQLES